MTEVMYFKKSTPIPETPNFEEELYDDLVELTAMHLAKKGSFPEVYPFTFEGYMHALLQVAMMDAAELGWDIADFRAACLARMEKIEVTPDLARNLGPYGAQDLWLGRPTREETSEC